MVEAGVPLEERLENAVLYALLVWFAVAVVAVGADMADVRGADVWGPFAIGGMTLLVGGLILARTAVVMLGGPDGGGDRS